MREFRIGIIIIAIITIFFFLFVYPDIDDFSYYHMAIAINIAKFGNIDMDQVNTGFYVFTSILQFMTNISYESLPTIPLLSLPIIFLLISIFRFFFKNKNIFVIIAIMIYLTQSLNNRYGLFPHDVGLTLLLLAIFSCLYFGRRLKNKKVISILLVTIIISANFISYKTTSLILVFILVLLYLEINEDRNLKLELRPIFLTGIVFIFSYNKWLYNNFVPSLIHSNEFASSTGIGKLLLEFFYTKQDDISRFFFHRPYEITIFHTIWMIVIFINLLLLGRFLIKKILKNIKLSIEEKIIISIGISGILVLIIYTSLGFAEIGTIVLVGLIGYGITYDINKKFIIISLITLLLLNFGINIVANNSGYYGGQKDQNNFLYISPLFNWYNGHVNNSRNNVAVMDIFTGGYFKKEYSKLDTYKPIAIFSRDRVLMILDPYNYSQLIKENPTIVSYNVYDIVNYNEHYFTINGWDLFKSWSNYRKDIDENPYFKKIYSSGDIDVLV